MDAGNDAFHRSGAIQMMADHPKEVHHALEALLETNKKLLDRLIEAGIDGIFLSTQWACGQPDFSFSDRGILPSLRQGAAALH